MDLTTVVDVDTLQQFQDNFALSAGISCLTEDFQGNAITCPSLFSDCCSLMVRKSKIGYNRCLNCDMRGAEDASRTGKPAVYQCHAGLIDFAAPLVVEGRHIGAIYGGQVLAEHPREDKFHKIAVEMGLDPDEYVEAVKRLPVLPEKTINAAAKTLHLVAANVSVLARQKRELEVKKRQLLQTNEFLNKVFTGMSDMVLVADKAQRIVRMNRVAEEMIGKKAEELINKPIWEVIRDGDPGLEKMLNLKKEYSDIEILLNTGEGCINCLSSSRLLKDEQGRLSGGIFIIHPLEKKRSFRRIRTASVPFQMEDFIGESPQIEEIKRNVLRMANSMSTVLLEGESGTGKEVVAQAIHNESSRRYGPFIAVNCGAIPGELINSELFGYTEGAFTGARKGGSPGKFELASGGTIFLDEIGDMPLEQQVVLLRVLQDKEVTRVGGRMVIPLDVRVICATNKPLQNEIIKGNFRQDLYYRLNVLSMYIPPLRSRPQDIPLLFHHFLDAMSSRENRSFKHVESGFMECLQGYGWPGNIRELQNVTERVFHLAAGDTLSVRDLPPEIVSRSKDLRSLENSAPNDGRAAQKRNIWRELKAEQEAQKIKNLLDENGGNVSQVAKIMGISRNSLYRKINRYDIFSAR